MKELTFKVSAKTARLFGRENASNAEAAIAELVKNAYDADATQCLICLLPTHMSEDEELTRAEYEYLRERNSSVDDFYVANGNGGFQRLQSESPEFKSKDPANRFLRDLWIIDNGTGMSAETIEKCWMVIGTNDKQENVMSPSGRARTGAKGIGRFALDRLGAVSTVYSTSNGNDSRESITWKVDWRSFDQEGTVLEDIPAELHENTEHLDSMLARRIEISDDFKVALKKGIRRHWKTGTAIRIGRLRDEWSRPQVDRLNTMLAALVPPLRQRPMQIHLIDALQIGEYGRVEPTVLDDFDYKLEADVDHRGDINFKIYRRELNVDEIDPDLFNVESMKKPPFSKRCFGSDSVQYVKDAEELFGMEDKNFKRKIAEVGPFEMQLLFYKKAAPNQNDSVPYPYRKFLAGPRNAWLKYNGGIKIFRDNFAVRPYGEVGGRAFDWLAIGERKASNPAPASRKGWRASPQQLAGTVRISRNENSKLYDQANREGIIDNEHFAIFRKIVLRIIEEFEDDRSHILHNINLLHNQKNPTEEKKKRGAKKAKAIVSNTRDATVEDAKQLAEVVEAQITEISELKDEQAMLRSLATIGTVLVSFSHEMAQLQNAMGDRSSSLSKILRDYILSSDLKDVARAFNPYEILKDWKSDDKKVKQWFTFVLSSIKANRRRRHNSSSC